MESIKKNNNCPATESVYQCLSDTTTDEIFSKVQSDAGSLLSIWHPVPDEDFFAANISEETYGLSKRSEFSPFSMRSSSFYYQNDLFVQSILCLFCSRLLT